MGFAVEFWMMDWASRVISGGWTEEAKLGMVVLKSSLFIIR